MRTRQGSVPGNNCSPGVLYELPLDRLELTLSGGVKLDVTYLLSSGRANYLLFQDLVGRCTGWASGSEGGDSDLSIPGGKGAEVKAYYDPTSYPDTTAKYAAIHTAASSTFGPNNNGPKVKALLKAGDYAAALDLCTTTGYTKNAYYVYTNTRGYRAGEPLKYLVVPTTTVLANLSKNDPRTIDRTALMSLIRRTRTIDPATLTR